MKKGTGEEKRHDALGLARVLANTFKLYQKTHAFHWNVEGAHFSELHLLFEQQYEEIWKAADVLAERLRALGYYVPATSADFEKLSAVKEELAVPSANLMIKQLAQDHETLIGVINEVYRQADDVQDKATTSIYEERLVAHEKHLWMLNSFMHGMAEAGVMEKTPLSKLMG